MITRSCALLSSVSLLLALSLAGCSGGGGGGDGAASTSSSTNTTTNTSTSTGNGAGVHRLSGQVVVKSADLQAARLRSGELAMAKAATIHFATSADAALPNAEVTLYKVNADGTETVVEGVTATTDASGNYTLANVPDAVTGTGQATDYYYEVRAKSGSLEVSAPVAPTEDAVVNITPETKIAAAMISDVASVPDVSAAPVLPMGKAIDLLRDAVFANIGNMSTFTLPSMQAGDESKVDIAASAISANNGNAEKLMRAFEALKEGLYLRQNRDTVTEARVAAYLERVTKSACNFQQNVKLPQAASAALAKSFNEGATFTLKQVADAFQRNGGFPVPENSVVTAYYDTLAGLNTALSGTGDIPDSAMLGIYISRGGLGEMTTASTFEVDQALALLQAMAPSQQRCQAPLSYRGIAADLTGDATLTTVAAFSDVEVYHQRMNCPSNPNEPNNSYLGSLAARVQVFTPQGDEVSGITIFAPGLKDQHGNAISSAMTMSTGDFPSPGGVRNNWDFPANPQDPDGLRACMKFGETYTFTITATLKSGGTLTAEVSRTVVDVPEAKITLMAKDYTENAVFNFAQGSTGQPNTPFKLTSAQSTERPMFKWTPAPGDAQAVIAGAPAGSKLKYLFDVSHFDGGAPESRNFTACPVGSNNNKFFEKDYILSPIDCDVDKCNAALPDRQHVCRIHVQTVLVDEYDRTLGWSAGADLYYCIEGQSNCP